MPSNRITKKISRGFTLIETMVSLALFSVVLVISGGVIVSVIDINKRNQAISAVVNNLNYSIDSMVRDIKTGYLYKCGSVSVPTIEGIKADTDASLDNCATTDTITLVSTIAGDPMVVRYQFVPSNTGNGYIKKTIYTADTSVPGEYSITDKVNVNIESVNFNISNPATLECVDCGIPRGQPSVSIIIKGMAGNNQIETSKFYVQTFISQRVLNLTDFKDND